MSQGSVPKPKEVVWHLATGHQQRTDSVRINPPSSFNNYTLPLSDIYVGLRQPSFITTIIVYIHPLSCSRPNPNQESQQDSVSSAVAYLSSLHFRHTHLYQNSNPVPWSRARNWFWSLQVCHHNLRSPNIFNFAGRTFSLSHHLQLKYLQFKLSSASVQVQHQQIGHSFIFVLYFHCIKFHCYFRCILIVETRRVCFSPLLYLRFYYYLICTV